MFHGKHLEDRTEMSLVRHASVKIYFVSDTNQNEKWLDASMMLMETIEPLDAPIHQTQTNN